jgi:hypothetical protein
MSKAHAFKCDYCGKLVAADDCVGVSPIEDMFDKLRSFPVIPNVDKAEIHFCASHYKEQVTAPAEAQYSRRINEEMYAMKVKELSYDLRKTTVDRHRAFAIARNAKKR